MRVTVGAMAFAVLAAGRPGAQAGWMPPEAGEGIAREIAGRLEKVNVGIDPAKLLPSARAGVASLRERLDAFGEKRVIGLAPRFPRLKLPPSGKPHLDAMAAFSMCTYYLDARFKNPPRGAGVDVLLDAAMGPLSLAVTTMYLRHHYLRAGGTDGEIKAFLDGDPLNAIAFAVQKDPKLLEYTAEQCRPAVSALLD